MNTHRSIGHHQNTRAIPPWRRYSAVSGTLFWRWLGLVVAGGVVIGLLTLKPGEARDLKLTDEIKPLWQAPKFTLVERSGQRLSTTDLLGKVWIANFIFTRCVDTCTLASRRMAQLQKAFAAEEDLRLISITADPVHDMPAVLSRYAEKLGAHPQRWLFLTGNKEQIYRLAREGFRMGVMDPNDEKESSAVPALRRIWEFAKPFLKGFEPAVAWAHHTALHPNATPRAIQHSERFVLVDRQGQIRHYYDSRDAMALQRLQHHVHLLLRERF